MDPARQLIIQAFRQARDSGKPDWHRMTTAVLKNRLLTITDREFSETAYGASSLTDFVSRYSDMLDLDSLKFPMEVELKQNERARLGLGYEPSARRNVRIKGELWRAIFDRSSGNTYYWLADLGIVGTSPTSGNCPILPTVNAETDKKWRQAFLESLPSIPQDARDWAGSLLPLSQLPQDLRHQWNRTQTENAYQLLLSWFKEQGVDPPSDFVTEIEPRQESRVAELEALRRLVQRVVHEMTEEELAQLPLPPRAIFRAVNQRR